jgi:hypothetical protein
MTIKGKHILTSVALLPEEHGYLVDRARNGESMSAIVREAIRLLMSQDMKNLTSDEPTADEERVA